MRTYQVIKDVNLVDMDCDKGLIFDPVKFTQIIRGLFNEYGENTVEVLFCVNHNLSVILSIF